MKVFYHSALADIEITPGSVFRHFPGPSYLEVVREKNDRDYDVIFNGSIIDSIQSTLEFNTEAELTIRKQGEKHIYTVKPMVHPLSNEYALAYEQFADEFGKKTSNELDSIKNGFLKMYAIDQSSEVHDWTDIFDKIEDAFSSFKSICEKPKSHLKAVNEVRPIETVKRIGYESIPYLAAHSEDWLAKTASGLKPARLFSRVEDDEYQIYENRVVKTLIDIIISFLRKKEKELKDQFEQLHGIVNSSVQTGSFGFDVSFQKAVAELFSSDSKGDEHRTKALELVENLYSRSHILLKRYRTLRQTRLYKYLKKSKIVTNPLNETNILIMDKNYSVIFKLWKTVRQEIIPQQVTEESIIDFQDTYSNYLLFCKTLCGYTAHTLNFDICEDGRYHRQGDELEFSFVEDNGLIRMRLCNKTKRSMNIPKGLFVPINPGDAFEKFYYDGTTLFWENTADTNDIERFCSLFKSRESRGKEQADEKKKYSSLKIAIDEKQKEYKTLPQSEIVIIPAIAELESDNRNTFKEYINKCIKKITKNNDISWVIIALPKCDENEQKIIEYAKNIDEQVLILPLTMFDINSFRRLQNIMLRQIITLKTNKCPYCGGDMREKDNQFVCDNCNQLILTKTICPNPDCRHEYYYLSYDISEDIIDKMHSVDRESFYQWDSLYQYKDIINMSVESGKLRTICPNCKC